MEDNRRIITIEWIAEGLTLCFIVLARTVNYNFRNCTKSCFHILCIEFPRYEVTPVTEKYLCVVAKILVGNRFIITAYFTDTIKRGEVLWRRK